jgi:ABC-type transport system involved in cytochrome bd biosynthesis fused ATPase/permease subunit
MSAQETARSLGTTVDELTAALHDPPGTEIKTTEFGLRMDQAAAAFHVLTSGRRVEVIVGPAGSGKTRVLAQIGRERPGSCALPGIIGASRRWGLWLALGRAR